MRTVFFGTPAIAVPALQALTEISEVVGVVCQPDRPAGRGRKLTAPPVKRVALDLGLDVHQPLKVKTGTLHEWLAARETDVAVVMAYGRILPEAVLNAPRNGCMNLHASLLPKYRGAAPINWCLVQGEERTGISLMQMDQGMDTGPVYCSRSVPIDSDDDAGSLTDKLARLAAIAVREDLPRAVGGEFEAKPQDETLATYAPLIERHDTRIDFSRPAREVVNLVRGMSPRPGAHTTLRGSIFKVHRFTLADETPRTDAPPGLVSIVPDRRVVVACGAGTVELEQAQPAGRRIQTARDLINGRMIQAGDVLGRDDRWDPQPTP